MGKVICPTPHSLEQACCVLSPVGLLARKWGSFSLLPDCVITHPIFLTPQTCRGRTCPHALRLSKSYHKRVGSKSALDTLCNVGDSRRVALGCPGLEAEPVPRSPTPDPQLGQGGREAGEKRPRAAAGRSPLNEGHGFTFTPRPQDRQRPGTGAPPPADLFLCGFSCPGLSVASPDPSSSPQQ